MFDEVIKEVKAKLKAKQKCIIIDVREEEEYQKEHIETAILIPLANIETIDYDLKTEIYVYCHSGQRAMSAKRKLVALGYENVKVIGGIIQWNRYQK